MHHQFHGKKWFYELGCRRINTGTVECSGRSIEIPTPGTIEKIHDFVLADRRLKVREIVKVIGFSYCLMPLILNHYLGIRKLFEDGCLVCLQLRSVWPQPQSERVLIRWTKHGFSSQHTGEQAVVKTMGFSGPIGAKESQGESTLPWEVNDLQNYLFYSKSLRYDLFLCHELGKIQQLSGRLAIKKP